MIEEELTWGDEHPIHDTDDVLQNCIPGTNIILLTNVTPINSIKKKKKNQKIKGTAYLKKEKVLI